MLPHNPSRTFSVQKKDDKPLSTWGKLKQMVKDYWYIIIPVEIGTSIAWYASIYLSLQSGLDIVSLLETLGASEATLARLPSAEAGYHALAFICYKVISPLRHGLSLAITSVVVARLEKTSPGYLKTSGDLARESREMSREGVEMAKEKYEDAWENFVDQKHDFKEKFDERKDDWKEKFGDKREEMKDDLERLKQKYKNK